MPATRRIDTSRVTHLFVGYSSAFLARVERTFSAGQVLFLEEAEVITSRNAAASCASVKAVAGILEAPTQDEKNAESIPLLLARPPCLKAIIPSVEYGVVAAAALAQAWGLPGAGFKAARILRDKAELRQLAGLTGIRQPAWSIVGGPAEIEEFQRAHGGHCVVKPVDRQGSLGVTLIGPGDDADEAWAEVISIREPAGLRAREGLGASLYLAEERVSGLEASVQALVAAGQVLFTNITVKDMLPGRYPVELAHTLPAEVPADLAAELIKATGQLVKAADYQYGMVHAEWIVADRVPYLIECAARVPGDRITTLIDLAYGIRVVDALLLVMAGLAPPALGGPRLGASVRYLTAEPGVITAISGVDEAWDMSDVVDVTMTAGEGSTVRPLRGSMDRIGSVIAVSQTADEARASAAQAAAAIKVTTEGTL